MAKEKIITDALRIEAKLEEGRTGKTRARRVAEVLFDEAINGNIAAIKEINDRLEGKAAQPIIGGDDDDPAVRFIGKIERTIVRPNPQS